MCLPFPPNLQTRLRKLFRVSPSSREFRGKDAIDPLASTPCTSAPRDLLKDDDETVLTDGERTLQGDLLEEEGYLSEFSDAPLEHFRTCQRHNRFFPCSVLGSDSRPPWEPVDIVYQVSLQQLYDLIIARIGKPYFAPVDAPKYIMELGAGTCDWSIDVARRFPSANVISLDRLPQLFPESCPQNLELEVDDIEQGAWTHSRKRFDFIFTKNLQWIEDYTSLLQQIFRCLKPGASVELWWMVARTTKQHSGWLKWKELCKEIHKSTGRQINPTNKMQDILINSGFENVCFGSFPMGNVSGFDILGEILLPLVDVLNWEVESVKQLHKQMVEDLPSMRFDINIFYASKPGAS